MKKINKPEDIAHHFADAWNQNSAQGIADLFSDDADFINVTGLWWQSKQDIFQAHDYGLRVIFKQSTLKLIKTKVRHLNDDIAIVQAKIRLTDQTAPSASANRPQTRTTIFTFVAKKENDHWLCYAAQNTEVQAGKETFIRKENGDYEAVSYR